jgi:hypothetical protein
MFADGLMPTYVDKPELKLSSRAKREIWVFAHGGDPGGAGKNLDPSLSARDDSL